jgi:hypothetical protein
MSQLLKFILVHPLNRKPKRAAVSRFISWQIASCLMTTKLVIPFVDQFRLLVRNGMTGATSYGRKLVTA